MNLGRVLTEALPDLPPLRQEPRYLLHPQLIVREQQEREGPVLVATVSGSHLVVRLSHAQLQLARHFNGQRTCDDVVQSFALETGMRLDVSHVRRFAESFNNLELFYRTPQDQCAALWNELMQKRRDRLRTRKDRAFDPSTIPLFVFDPDNYLNWAHRYFSWLYSRWFTLWSLFMVVVMCVIVSSNWHQVWNDSVDFYNLLGNGLSHLAVFLLCFLGLGAFHETAHGLTCKHYGGEVRRMGAMLVFGIPAIFCDTTHMYVHARRWQRFLVIAAGVWSEIVICSYATVVWWVTPPGSFVHQAAYLIILSGGMFCVMVNWNPLSRLDGYYMMCELLRFPEMRITATTFLSAWLRKNVFGLSATVPVLPRRRAIGFGLYAAGTVAYCYGLMLFFVKVVYHIAAYYSATWAFVPAALLALRIFYSRLVKLYQFSREIYMDKRAHLSKHRFRIAAAAVALLIAGVVPVRREFVQEKFVLEPVHRAVLRAEVPGRVSSILADEGQHVAAGEVIAQLRDLSLESRAAQAATDARLAQSRATAAQLQYGDFATAEQHRRQASVQNRELQNEAAHLLVRAPISGTVITPRVRDLQNSYLTAGTLVAEVADLSVLRARVFVPESEMRKLQSISGATLRMSSAWLSAPGTVVSISPAAQEPAPGLMSEASYRGMGAPDFFAVTVQIPNAEGRYREGMTGLARIYGRRRAVLATLLQPVVDAVARRVW